VSAGVVSGMVVSVVVVGGVPGPPIFSGECCGGEWYGEWWCGKGRGKKSRTLNHPRRPCDPLHVHCGMDCDGAVLFHSGNDTAIEGCVNSESIGPAR